MKKFSHEDIKRMKPTTAEVLEKRRSPIFALLDNVRSAHNVGAIFRTSEGVLLQKLFLCGITPVPPKKEILKTALGAEELVPWEYCEDAVEAVKKLKNEGVKIIAVELAYEAVRYDKMDFEFPICLVFGNEVNGISDDLMQFADDAIYLPMLGRANSLNVATCYGIVVYEALKKLKLKNI